MKCCFYGVNGTGKTSLIGTMPKPTALFSFEPQRTGGATSVSGIDGITVYRYGTKEQVKDGEAEFSSMEEAVLMARELVAARGGGFASVGVDSATSIEWRHLEELMRAVGREMPDSLTFGEVPDGLYQQRTEKAKSTLREFLEIPAHVVVTAKEKDHNPPIERKIGKNGKVQPDLRNRIVRGMQPESWIAPALGFSTMSWLLDACGYVGRMYFAPEVVVTGGGEINGVSIPAQEVETGRYVLKMRCKQHPNYAARFQCPDKDRVPEDIVDPTFEKILAVVSPRSRP